MGISTFALDDQGKPLKGDALLDFVYELGGDTIFLQFSTGKDSICSWLRLREYGRFKKIIPYFMYWFPDLSWQEEALDYYEQWFGQRILRLPLPNFHANLRAFMYQTPDRIGCINGWNLADWDFADLENALAVEYGIADRNPYAAVGFRGADNVDRRNLIIQKGAVGTGRRRYFFPVWEYDIRDVAKVIGQSGIKLPADYRWNGRTTASWIYQYINPIRLNYPGDWEKVVKLWLPLIDAEIFRHETVFPYANKKMSAIPDDALEAEDNG